MLAIRQKKSLEIILNTISTALGSSLSKKSILLNSFALKIFKKSQNVITFSKQDQTSTALPGFQQSGLSMVIIFTWLGCRWPWFSLGWVVDGHNFHFGGLLMAMIFTLVGCRWPYPYHFWLLLKYLWFQMTKMAKIFTKESCIPNRRILLNADL